MKNVIFLFCFLFLFSGLVNAATVEDDALTTFSAGSTAKAAEVNANFAALKDAINENAEHNHDENYYPKAEVDGKINSLNTQIGTHGHDSSYYTKTQADDTFLRIEDQQTGGNYIPNSTFEAGMMGWETVTDLSAGIVTLVDTPNGSASEFALQNDANAVVWGSSTNWITIDRKKTYYISGSFLRQAGGSVGNIYLAVRLRKADGSEIDGNAVGGTTGAAWWYYPAANQQPPEGQWTHYRKQFGNGTNHPFPDDARYATVAFILNYDNGVSGTRIYNVQGLAIHDALDNKCGANMKSYGSGCISDPHPAADFYVAQANCKSIYKGTICMYNEYQRACASGVISQAASIAAWMGDHGIVPSTGGLVAGNGDDEFFVTNRTDCHANMDGAPQHSTELNAYRCCR